MMLSLGLVVSFWMQSDVSSIKQFYNIDIIQGNVQDLICIGGQIVMEREKIIGQNLPNKNASSRYAHLNQ